MEQRIDPKIQTEFAAGTDPAYIPGLVAPSPPRPEETGPGRAEDESEEPAVADDDATAQAKAEKGEEQPEQQKQQDEADEPDESEGSEGPDDQDEKGGRAEAGGPEGEPAPEDGPVFEVSDRRGSITADREGVRFRLDDQEAEFDWDEIGAVEVTTPRFGRRFTVTVHTSARRWFDAEVEAPSKKLLKEWEAELDVVLDAYFEET
ncbi:hypothetical protein ACIQ7D_14100 [Streptomyces sp. NPDC096310]|uniref:hypothetical protein n=1 Tax=Streptomyces sp. NPDC096310 TaxID=3366082 RepID=UPI00380B8164